MSEEAKREEAKNEVKTTTFITSGVEVVKRRAHGACSLTCNLPGGKTMEGVLIWNENGSGTAEIYFDRELISVNVYYIGFSKAKELFFASFKKLIHMKLTRFQKHQAWQARLNAKIAAKEGGAR